MSTLRAVIFDYTTLEDTPPDVLVSLQRLVGKLRSVNVKLAVFSNDAVDLTATLRRQGLPDVDLFLTADDVGKKKGAKEWVAKASEVLRCPHHHMLYVGDSFNDWTTAINSAVMYLQAGWSQTQSLKKESLRVDSPDDVWVFITHFLLQPPRWQYSLDGGHSNLRCLLNATTNLPGKRIFPHGPVEGFALKDVFTYGNEVQIGAWSARNALMMHAITSLYLEGLIPQGPFFAAYPSHTPGQHDPLIEDWFRPAAKTFHGWFKEDLLVRVQEAPDTSLLRASGKQATPEMQMRTVHLNPAYRTKLPGKTIILIDDFSTEGTSLEWGRRLLLAAGAARVVMLSIGKFGRKTPLTHTGYKLNGDAALNPYAVTDIPTQEIFTVKRHDLVADNAATERIIRSFELLEHNAPCE